METISASQAKYIVIDGIDGGGKGSLLERLHEEYPVCNLPFRDISSEDKVGKYFIQTREPGGTPVGEKMRKLLVNDFMHPFSELCLFMAQRFELRKIVTEPALINGINILSDRSESSTFAYQIRGKEHTTLEGIFWDLNKMLQPFPSLYIILDLDPVIAARRMAVRKNDGQPTDRFDQEDIDFFGRVRAGFKEFATKVAAPCHFVNAEQTKEEVARQVIAIIDEHVGRTT